MFKDDLVEINQMNFIGADSRGDTHEFNVRPNGAYIFLNRSKGTMSGNTYHSGKTEATNPKIFVLLLGEIEFFYRHIKSKKHFSKIISFPCVIKINPNVTHAVKAISNISMLECNSILDIQNDRYHQQVILEHSSANCNDNN